METSIKDGQTVEETTTITYHDGTPPPPSHQLIGSADGSTETRVSTKTTTRGGPLGMDEDTDPLVGSWDIPREPSDGSLLPEMAVLGGRHLSIRERIRLIGAKRYKDKPLSIEEHVKGLRQHIHYSYYESVNTAQQSLACQ